MSLTTFINSNETLKSAQELVFFAGSFNPWHSGHSSCVELLSNEKVLIVAPDHNPFKELVAKKHCDLSFIEKEILTKREHAFIFDGFLALNKKNPTSAWISELKTEFAHKDLSLLLGFDSFASIDRWTNAEDLLNKLSNLYVASRMDDPSIKEEQVLRLKQIAPNLNIVFLGRHPHEEVSSTKLRQKLD